MRSQTILKCAGAVLSVAALTSAAGCGLPRPASPNVENYERPALRSGESSQFLQTYSEKLSKALREDEALLDTIQAGPLLDRTRAELLVAEAEDTSLNAAEFSSVVAGGPGFSDYPMWFVGFGRAADEKAGTQALLVTRTSAAEDWKAVQGLFVSNEDVPALVTDESGAVVQADASFGTVQQQVRDTMASYLSSGDGKVLEDAQFETKGSAFQNFRDYVGGYSGGDNAFDAVKSECRPYDQLDLSSMSLSTETGAVAFGEIRCSITLEVPAEFAITLPAAVEAVTTGDTDGNRVIIETSVPYLLKQDGGSTTVVGSDWFLLEARTEKS